jgi:hypothetical protein
MSMTRSGSWLFVLAVVFCAVPLRGDSLGDLKSAVGRLTARQPVRAIYTVDSTTKASGKLANQTSVRTVTAEVSHDGKGVTITIPQELVERATRGTDREESTHAIDGIRSSSVVEALDYRAPFLELLKHGKVVEETRVPFRGAPVRRLVLELDIPQTERRNQISIGSSKVAEDRLTVWVGDDHFPLAAERFRKTSGGVMMIRASMTVRTSFTFARAGDRLILARRESASDGSVMGTKIDESSIQTVTVR